MDTVQHVEIQERPINNGVFFGRRERLLVSSFDAAGAILSGAGAWLVWSRILDYGFVWWHAALLAALGTSWALSLAFSKALNGRLRRSLLDDLPTILNHVLVVSTVVAIGVMGAMLDPYPASLVLATTAVGAVIMPTMRGLAYAWLTYSGDKVRQRILVVGAGEIGTRMARLLSVGYQPGMEVVGFLDRDPLRSSEPEESRLPVLGSSYDLERVIRDYRIDKVVIAFSTAPHHRVLEMIWECDRHGVEVSIVPRFFEATTIQSMTENVRGVPLLHLNRARLVGYSTLLKRVFDISITTAALLVIWPLLLTIALIVKLDSPGPVVFSQKRAGHDGKVFTMYKFRSMKVGAQNTSNWTLPGDPRRTRVGRFLREFSLDELPQFINVLKGDMSLIGPRPEVWDRSQELAQTIYRYNHRYRVKSGLTGWAQVNGFRGELTSLEERVVFDNFYIENWSIWLDIKIIALTLFKAIISAPERTTTPQDQR